jgi:hypothetical protein
MSGEQQLLELIANSRKGILAAVSRTGYPPTTNVAFVLDQAERSLASRPRPTA